MDKVFWSWWSRLWASRKKSSELLNGSEQDNVRRGLNSTIINSIIKTNLEPIIENHTTTDEYNFRTNLVTESDLKNTTSYKFDEIDYSKQSSSQDWIEQISTITTTTAAATTSTTTSSSIVSTSSALSTIFDYEGFYNRSEIFSNLSMPINNVSSFIGFDEDVDRNSEEFLLGIFLNNCSNASDCCNFYNNNRSLITTIILNRNDTTSATVAAAAAAANCTPIEFGGYDLEAALQLITILGTAAILGLIILATVIGNVFVIAAILLERHLQSVANYLILSLAVADLLVACLVMPLSAVYEVSKEWKLGPELCDMWTSCDVLCCTASILHLVAIALDRYWAVTNIDYIHQRTARRIGVMILIIWALSFLVSIAPLLGWKDPKWDERVSIELKCMVSQDIGYQIFATASSFYVPLFVILVLYWRIFQTARKRIRRRQQAAQTHPEPLANASCLALTAIGFRWKVTATQPTSGGLIATAAGGSGGIAAAVVTVIGRPLPTISETTTAFTNISSTHTSPEKGSYGNGVERIENDPPTADISTYGGSTIPIQQTTTKPIISRKKNQTSVDSKRERKAAKTLAIITGAFVCCWLPFFILAILLPICQCDISPLAMSFSLWLGYFNSTLNPIIYTIFSPEFRHAFKRILCGKRNSIRRRTRCVRR